MASPASELDLSSPAAVSAEPEVDVGIKESKAVKTALEFVVAGGFIVFVMALFGGGAFALAWLGDWIKDWFSGTPRLSSSGTWIAVLRLRQIMKGKATHSTVMQLLACEREMEQEEGNACGGRWKKRAAANTPAAELFSCPYTGASNRTPRDPLRKRRP